MMTFMARLLHTPPSRFSRPSTVPLEVAGGEGDKRDRVEKGEGRGEGGNDGWGGGKEKKSRREGEKMTHWLMSTSIAHRTNQYLRQALISCSSD